jgi:hypothetical protein
MAQKVVRQATSGAEIIQLALRLGLLAFLVYWSFVLVRPFIPILAWSMVLMTLYPRTTGYRCNSDRPKLAATIITVVNLAIVIGPVTWLGYGVIDGLQGARQLGAGTWSFRHLLKASRWPVVGAQIYQLWDHASKPEGRAQGGRSALEAIGRAGACLRRQRGPGDAQVHRVGGVVGLLFHYGPGLVAAIKGCSALVAQRSRDFVALAGVTIRTIARGHRRSRPSSCWPESD